VASVGFMAALMSLAVIICLGIGHLTQWLCAQSVADFAALTAADAASGRIPGYPCELAAKHAEREHYFLEACEVEDASGTGDPGGHHRRNLSPLSSPRRPKNSEVNLTQ